MGVFVTAGAWAFGGGGSAASGVVVLLGPLILFGVGLASTRSDGTFLNLASNTWEEQKNLKIVIYDIILCNTYIYFM